MKPVEILKQYFGYSQLREPQEQLIERLLLGTDVLGIMPTGAGKSICYQVPALLKEGVTLVISPLISLMKDQVDALRENGVSAALINSSLSAAAYQKVMDEALEGKYKLIYVAPERLESYDFRDMCQRMTISMIAVDEAHCVSQWGHDFRPSYRGIADFIRMLPVRPVIGAFTATATPKVKEDIQELITLKEPFVLTTGFDRPNLYFEVHHPKQKGQWVMEYLREHASESGIIYCATRKAVDALYEKLRTQGYGVGKYHAGMGEKERNAYQEDFIFDRIPIMIATNAFGMGIDKSNVRYVIHYNMPKNMEGYYQEAGRGGRDGLDAKAILLYSAADIMTNRLLIENGSHGQEVNHEYHKLNQMVDYCNTEGCLRNFILSYFEEDQVVRDACGHCSNCHNQHARQKITVEAQKILSCIKRMKERFGTGVVIDVLRGSRNQKMRQFGFEELSTYGLMREYSKENLKEMIAYLVSEKYIELEAGQFPVLKVGVLGYSVLKGEQEVEMRIVLQQEDEMSSQQGQLPIDRELFECLKKQRHQLAQQQNIPPFMVFSDMTLGEMASYYPTTEEEMLTISGVGQLKYQKYGKALEQVIQDFVREHGIEKPEIHPRVQVKRESGGEVKDTVSETYGLYQQGLEIAEIAKVRNLSPTTIENHLAKCIEQGLECHLEKYVSPEEVQMIEEVIHKVGVALLKPI
ncbi:MAG: DNA helicase RecQ, partial [Cellulosilyticaceae bacterium]